VGRAGWTWYTGSAAWMYRVAVESILGFELRGDLLAINPCIPAGWPEFEIVFRRAETTWHIRVLNPHGVERGISSIQLDGEPIAGDSFPIVEDNSEHQVVISVLPARSSNSAPGTRTAKVVEKPPGR
jgi:cellobiose phosphorylase